MKFEYESGGRYRRSRYAEIRFGLGGNRRSRPTEKDFCFDGKLRVTLFAIFISLVWFVFCEPTFAAQASSKKTLTRKSDPVVVTGELLEQLEGADIERIRVYAAGANGVLAPIPFQIDEREAGGSLVFPFGPKKTKDADPAFDANDELIFMVKDTGCRVARAAWPKAADKGAEIEVTDPLNGAKGWVYAFTFASPPPRSTVDYVSVSPTGFTVTTPYFVSKFCRDATISFCGIALTEAGGGDGKNYMDRLKVRAHAATKYVRIPIDKSENDFSSELLAYIDGPVRVIRRTNNKMFLFWKIPTPGSIVDNVYYFNSFIFPTEVDVPFDLAAMLEEVRFRVTTDHSSRAKGFRFINSNNPAGTTIDGKMDASEKSLKLDPYEWMLIRGTAPGRRGGWLNRLTYDPGVGAKPFLYYIDDEKAADAPESERGQLGNIGYDIRNMELLKKGVWRLTSYMYNVPDYRPGDEKEFLDILDNPVKITVR